MSSDDPTVRRNTIAARDAGIEMTYGGTPGGVVPWENIARVSATAFEVGTGDNLLVFRHVTIYMLDGEFIELAAETDGLEETLSQLDRYLEVLVENPARAFRELVPGSPALDLARAG